MATIPVIVTVAAHKLARKGNHQVCPIYGLMFIPGRTGFTIDNRNCTA
jgi:hypothetical protein